MKPASESVAQNGNVSCFRPVSARSSVRSKTGSLQGIIAFGSPAYGTAFRRHYEIRRRLAFRIRISRIQVQIPTVVHARCPAHREQFFHKRHIAYRKTDSCPACTRFTGTDSQDGVIAIFSSRTFRDGKTAHIAYAKSGASEERHCTCS